MPTSSGTTPGGSRNSIGTTASSVGTAKPSARSISTRERTREGEHERDGGAGGDGRGRSGQRERGRGDEERGRHREVDPALRARRALDHPAAGVVERALGVGGDRQRSQAFAQLRNAAHAPVIGRAARTLRRFVRGRPGLDEWRIERRGRRADLVGAPPGCVLERKGCLT